MAEITRFFAFRHLRSEAASHVVVFRRGRRVRSGRGLGFWFDPDHTSIMEIPADDRDTDFVFPARSRDYQVVTVQGTITWRAAEPDALAVHVDFTVDLRTGPLRTEQLDRFLLGPEDVVVAVGQDGLVANLAKYLDGHHAQRRAADGARRPAGG